MVICRWNHVSHVHSMISFKVNVHRGCKCTTVSTKCTRVTVVKVKLILRMHNSTSMCYRVYREENTLYKV